MNNEQLEEIMKNAQRVQEQLEKSGALKAAEVMNNCSIHEMGNKRSSKFRKEWNV